MKQEVARKKEIEEHEKLKKLKQNATDVEMKDEKSDAKVEEPQDKDLLTVEDIKDNVRNIERTVTSKEPRFVLKVLRTLVSLRGRLNDRVLLCVLQGYFPTATPTSDALKKYLHETMDTDSKALTFTRPKSGKQLIVLPETEIYIHLLLLIYLIDNKRYKEAKECADLLMSSLKTFNRRSMDLLAAKCFFYFSRAYELNNKLDEIRSLLHGLLRTCTLRKNFEGQAVIINLLLRNYLANNLYEQADKLVSKSTFPEIGMSSNNEWARHLYYLGRIRAIQLDYSEAHKFLVQALRKAPQQSAVGFKQTVQKLAVTVELLLGDIPDRATFRQPQLRKTLAPYFQLTQAVRTGNLGMFNQVLEKHGAKFRAEDTYTLIIRLRHNVIKTGIRKINLSYSRISLSDVAKKLFLDSPEDAEYIVAKAIRDGVIEASIDHSVGHVISKDTQDIYSTREPMAAFHQRIGFCLDIHNQAVKAMRFPPKSYNKDLESAEDRREREQQELESAKEIADEDYDAY